MDSLDSFQITALLCDNAQVSDGKLYILGGGWSMCGPGPFISAIAMKIDVPWTQTNIQHTLVIRLLDTDGLPVILNEDGTGIELRSNFEIGRPAGVLEGSTIDTPLAFNLGPMQLDSGQRYQWQIEIDGDVLENLIFSVR